MSTMNKYIILVMIFSLGLYAAERKALTEIMTNET
jgi:hypothetical protein